MSIVQTNVNYNYSLMVQDIYVLNRTYPFINVQIVGNSILGKNIYAIKLGRGSKQVFYSASIHANEWITSVLLMKFIEDYCNAYTNNLNLFNYSIRNLFNSTSIYIMPMVNPDGVDLVNNVLDFNSPAYLKARLISRQFLDIPFPSGWKANINGVDLKKFQPCVIHCNY